MKSRVSLSVSNFQVLVSAFMTKSRSRLLLQSLGLGGYGLDYITGYEWLDQK